MPKKCLEDMTKFSTWWRYSKNMEEIEFSHWLFEGKNVLPDGLTWLCYFAGSSKSHRENSISFIFWESPHRVDMKNVVKYWKDFLFYFTTLETYRVYIVHMFQFILVGSWITLSISNWEDDICYVKMC